MSPLSLFSRGRAPVVTSAANSPQPSTDRQQTSPGRSQQQSNGSQAMSKEYMDLATLSQLQGQQVAANNHLRAREMGDRQMRDHFPSWKQPEYDDQVRYNSPITTHQYLPQQANPNPWPWLALATVGVVAALAYWGVNRPQAQTQPTNTTTENTQVWLLEAGESP